MKIGATEIIVIIIVALFVIGPDKLPGYAKKLGKGLSSLKDSSNQLASEIRENVTEPLQDIVEPLQEIAEPLREISKPLDEATRSLKEIGKPRPKAVREAAANQETAETAEPTGEALYDVTEEVSGTDTAAALGTTAGTADAEASAAEAVTETQKELITPAEEEPAEAAEAAEEPQAAAEAEAAVEAEETTNA